MSVFANFSRNKHNHTHTHTPLYRNASFNSHFKGQFITNSGILGTRDWLLRERGISPMEGALLGTPKIAPLRWPSGKRIPPQVWSGCEKGEVGTCDPYHTNRFRPGPGLRASRKGCWPTSKAEGPAKSLLSGAPESRPASPVLSKPFNTSLMDFSSFSYSAILTSPRTNCSALIWIASGKDGGWFLGKFLGFLPDSVSVKLSFFRFIKAASFENTSWHQPRTSG